MGALRTSSLADTLKAYGKLFSIIKTKIGVRDVGIIPLLVSLPFMFYPMVLGGDTQPWIFVSGLIALLTFRTDQSLNKRDIALIILSLACILVYVLRSDSGYMSLRHAYTYLAFIVFWIVSQRDNGDYLPYAIKATVVIWFLVGIYQFVAIKLGYPIDIPGRYLAGRLGPPSLTAEASFYGSLSVLQIMYLLSDKSGKNTFFIVLAIASVLISGSLLAYILLIFPLMKLPSKFQKIILIVLPLLILADFYLLSSDIVSRIARIFSGGFSVSAVFHDPSLNLRAGHIYFTMVENLVPSLLMIEPVDFMSQYNAFAKETGILISTGAMYILPAMGEMIYGSGIFAALILLIIINRAQENCENKRTKVETVLFIIACMMNPISISNIFLILYITRKN